MELKSKLIDLDKNFIIVKKEKIKKCKFDLNTLYTIKDIKTNKLYYINEFYAGCYTNKQDCINDIINFDCEK